eukprot:11800-Chlamydomonas_euryale.AAC.1
MTNAITLPTAHSPDPARSALGLASRVASERGEAVGESVGYSVRLDSKHGPRTRLLFCTTGVLLRRLLGDPELDSVSHVVGVV